MAYSVDMCKSHKSFPKIPYELQIEILMRLPVKSLMRFKSVSKLWSSLLCSQYFTDCFVKVSSSPLRIYMRLYFHNSYFIKVLLSASSSHDSDLSSFVVDQDLTIPAMEGYSVSHVHRGLMCFVNGKSVKVYNTSTRQIVVLPDIEESKLIAEDYMRGSIMYHIGYDPIHNQYKVICTISVESVPIYMTEIWVFVLGGDGSSRWRKISSPFQPHRPFTQRWTINGRMYYVAWVGLLPYVLLSFDISSLEINILQEPEFQDFCPLFTDLIEYCGRVAVLDHRDKGVIKLWVMEDFEKNSWLMKTLVLHPSQRHIINGIRLKVQGTTRKGELVFVPHDIMCLPRTSNLIVKPQNTILFYVFLYNLQKNLLRKVEIKVTSNRNCTNFLDVIGLDDVENLMHL